MAGPFPGMDPWLEAPHLWADLHYKLITQAVAQLQPQLLPRGYFADLGERVWLAGPRRPVYPDDVIYSTRRPAHPPEDGAVAVLEADQPIRVRQADVEHHEGYVEIFEAEGHRLVTGIEFVSPANKVEREGRDLYQQKQRELREAGVNLVEVDLLRRGPHELDVPEEVVAEQRPWDYLVNLVRRATTEYEFYRIRLRERLPKVLIPLDPDETDAVLDLQAVFNAAYDIGPYRLRVDYTRPPYTPLDAADAEWADGVLRDQGASVVDVGSLDAATAPQSCEVADRVDA